MKIIGLGYKAKSGKDTLAKILAEQHGFLHYAFANPLKKVCQLVFGFNNDQVYGNKKEEVDPFWSFSPREAMQLVGNECFKPQFGSNIWVRMMERHIFHHETPYNSRVQGIVISDVRFLIEVDAIKTWGGKIVRVDRQGSGASQGVVGHASECELDNYTGWDHIIDNNGSLEQLEKQAAKLVL